MIQQQTSQPDFIPMDTPDFIPHQASVPQVQPSEPQGSAVMRFLKAGGSQYLGATLNAGPTSATPPIYGTPEWQQTEANLPKTNSEALSRMWQSITGAVKSPVNVNPLDALGNLGKQFNPVDVNKFQSGDTAGGLGSTAMNLLLLRSALKQIRGGAPEFNAPNTSEIVQPLSGYTKTTGVAPPPRPLAGLLQAAPIELGPSSAVQPTPEGLFPAARRVIQTPKGPSYQYLTSTMTEGPQTISKPTSLVEQYFIDKMRRGLEEQSVTGSAEQDAANARMAEYAKTPVDKAQAVRAQAEGQANAIPNDAPQFAYRVRDAGSTGIMPNQSAAQASINPEQVQGYSDYRAQAQNHPQEMVKIDLSKLDPSEYIVHGNGYVSFKTAVPEAFIQKMAPKLKSMSTGADLIQALQQMANKSQAAKAGRQ